jgi:hypothetical protein
MMLGEIKIESTDIKLLGKRVKGIKKGIPKVLSRAINKTAGRAKTQIINEVHKETTLKKKGIRRGIKQFKATQSKLIGGVSAIDDERIPLIFFSAKKFVSKAKYGGISYKMRGQKRKLQYRNTPEAEPPAAGPTIMTRMKSGHVGIFRRTDEIGKKSKRPKIFELMGPSIPKIIEQPSSIEKTVKNTVRRDLKNNIEIQTDVLIDQELRKV